MKIEPCTKYGRAIALAALLLLPALLFMIVQGMHQFLGQHRHAGMGEKGRVCGGSGNS